jgi:hypothetical protein
MVIIEVAQKSPKGREGLYVKFNDGTVYPAGGNFPADTPIITYSGSGQLKEADRIVDDGVNKREAYEVAADD